MKRNTIFLPKTIINPHTHGRDLNEKYKTTVKQVLQESLLGNIGISIFMPNTDPSITTIGALDNYLTIIKKAARDLGIADSQYVYFGLTDDNLDKCSAALEYPEVIGLKGYPLGKDGSVTTGKCGFIKSKTMIEGMKLVAEKNKVIAFHCDDPDIIAKSGNSIEAEVNYVESVIETAMRVPNVKVVICHVSCRESCELILTAQKNGMQIAIEISPRNLFFSCEPSTWNKDIHPNFYHCYNVLRSWYHVLYLRNLLCFPNSLVFIGTDDAQHLPFEKLGKRAAGMPGNREMVACIITLARKKNIYNIPDNQVQNLISYNAASFFNIPISHELEEYVIEEKFVDYDYNNGKVVNPWKGTALFFPARKNLK